MEHVYLQGIRNEILSRLSKAEKRINLAMAWFTNKDLLDALIACLNRGVSVDIVILDDNINRNDTFGLDFNRFIESGGNIYLFDPNVKLMHNKFCIIDDKELITGSYNWTNYAEYNNLENIIITDDQQSLTAYKDGFDSIISMAALTANYTRIPSSIFSRETFNGNYNEFLLEKQYVQKTSSVIQNHEPIVVEVENRQEPKSKYNIGFHAYINGNDNGMRVLIDKNQELPYTITKASWLNQDDITTISCEIYYGNVNDTINGNTKLVTLSLNIPPRKKKQLNFKTKVTMDTTGYLHIEFLCVETGICKETTILKSELINYE